jgi:hypothetical protein
MEQFLLETLSLWNNYSVSHQWCDLFHRLLHSYTRHIERVVRGGRDTYFQVHRIEAMLT